MRVTSPEIHYDLILHQTLITSTFKFKHIQHRKRTACLCTANAIPVFP